MIRVLTRTINPDLIVEAQLWEKAQEELREKKRESLEEDETNNAQSRATSPDVFDKDVTTRKRNGDVKNTIEDRREVAESSKNRNGDVIFRNGNSHDNNGYEHTEM